MPRPSSFAANLIALFAGLFALLLPTAAVAQTVVNTAHAIWSVAGQTFRTNSNTLSFNVAQQPVTIETFVGAPKGTQLTLMPSTCGTLRLSSGSSGTVTTLTASAIAATTLHIGETLYFRVTDREANRDPAAVEPLITQLSTSGGDKETITVYETGPDTGVFIGSMPTSAVPMPPVQGDCRLSVGATQSVAINVLSGGAEPLVTARLDVLTDPFGLVFDSEDASAVDGASVSLVDATSGAPAAVFAPDGTTAWPSTVTAGATVTDAAGNNYEIPPGEFRFPLVAPGTYRLVVTPLAPFTAPSSATATQLSGLLRPDGSHLEIAEGSYGKPFVINGFEPLRIDIPVDRPPVAMALTKTASRDRAEPGDVVFYTLTATNPEAAFAKSQVIVTDRPSSELRLRPGSVRVDGGAPTLGEVTVAPDGRTIAVALGTVGPSAKHIITYAMTVLPSARPGQAVNKAQVTDSRGLAGYATAVVKIDPDTLASRMTVIGRVTAGGCSYNAPHPGVPGVRVMLEDGSFAVTDDEGRFHFEGVVPGDHVVAAASETLPAGGRFVNCARSSRNAMSATSRFVDGAGGSIAVADFATELPAAATDALIANSARKHQAKADAKVARVPADIAQAR